MVSCSTAAGRAEELLSRLSSNSGVQKLSEQGVHSNLVAGDNGSEGTGPAAPKHDPLLGLTSSSAMLKHLSAGTPGGGRAATGQAIACTVRAASAAAINGTISLAWLVLTLENPRVASSSSSCNSCNRAVLVEARSSRLEGLPFGVAALARGRGGGPNARPQLLAVPPGSSERLEGWPISLPGPAPREGAELEADAEAADAAATAVTAMRECQLAWH